MGMELLRCQTPDTWRRRNCWPYLVAYNMIRCLMAQAVAQAGVQMDRLSFKGAVDAVRQYTPAIHRARSRGPAPGGFAMTCCAPSCETVPLRPHRQEPRAVSAVQEAYQLLNKPRHKFREVFHRCRYRATTPKKP